MAVPPLLLNVTAFAVLTVPTVWAVKATDPGFSTNTAAVPVPVNATVRAAAPPNTDTLKLAVLAPLEVGANATLMVQVAATATCVPQLLVCLN
jgi:hypothetical protein